MFTLLPASCPLLHLAFAILGPDSKATMWHSSGLPRTFIHKKDGLIAKEQSSVYQPLEGGNED